jgi:hypothetical protein
MYSFRYPQRSPSVHSLRDGTATPSIGAAALSLSGAAFAVSAAALPLLRSRDPVTCRGTYTTPRPRRAAPYLMSVVFVCRNVEAAEARFAYVD